MSRYVIAAKDPHQHICFVGYDPPLRTYFAQVLGRETFEPEELRDTALEELVFDDENMRLWIGTTPAEITDIVGLQSRIAEYAVIPEAVRLRLEQDQAQRSELTPLQREMHALISQWSAAEDTNKG